MYEHAYHMDYGAAAARYVDIYMEAIRWDNAAKLYDQYSREKLVAAVRDTLLKDAQLAGSATRLRRRSVMSRRTSQILALTIPVACDDFRITRTRTGKFQTAWRKGNPAPGSSAGHYR